MTNTIEEPKFKCTVRDGKFVEPCVDLSSTTEYGNPYGKQKGIFAWAFSNTEGPTRTVFGVKSGDSIRAGLVFNFCPFCGERIDGPVKL